jgi:hypothetical protein
MSKMPATGLSHRSLANFRCLRTRDVRDRMVSGCRPSGTCGYGARPTWVEIDGERFQGRALRRRPENPFTQVKLERARTDNRRNL